MNKKRKLDGKDDPTMFRLVMDNFKRAKIYRNASECVSTSSSRNIPATKSRNISSEQHVEDIIVSDLPEGWRREKVKMGKTERFEVITSQGLRITSQAAMDIHTKLHQMPNLRLDWQEMVVLPSGARFEPDDPVVLEMVPVDKKAIRNLEEDKEVMQILEQVACSESAQQEYINFLDMGEPVPLCNDDQSTRGGIDSTDNDCVVIYNTESILEVITKEEGDQDDDCYIVEQTDPEMILETVKDDPDMILETVKDDVNNCDILETVARSRSSHDRESYSSRDSVSSLIASSSESQTSSDSRLSSLGSVESNFSRDSTGTSNHGDEGTNFAKNAKRAPLPGSNELPEDLPSNWERRVHQRATGKQDWSIVTDYGRVIRSQKQLDILTKARGMQPLKLKGPSLSNTSKSNITPSLSDVVPEENCSSQRLQQYEREECRQDAYEILEPHVIKKASVSFISDDGVEVGEDSTGNLRKLRRRRGALLMEDRLVKRKDKLKLIEEAMRWLKPPLTKVNYLLLKFYCKPRVDTDDKRALIGGKYLH